MQDMTRRSWLARPAGAALGLGLTVDNVNGAGPGGLKIAKCEVFGLRIPYRASVRENMLRNYQREGADRPDYKTWVVRLTTEAGLEGLGESMVDPRPQSGGVSGRTAFELIHNAAVTPAVMMAVYDLVAQAGGVPVSRLFSPDPKPAVRQIWWSHCFRPDLPRLVSSRSRSGRKQ